MSTGAPSSDLERPSPDTSTADPSMTALVPRRSWVRGGVALGAVALVGLGAWIAKPYAVPTFDPTGWTSSIAQSPAGNGMTSIGFEASAFVTVMEVEAPPGVTVEDAWISESPIPIAIGVGPDDDARARWIEENPDDRVLDLPATLHAGRSLNVAWTVTDCRALSSREASVTLRSAWGVKRTTAVEVFLDREELIACE